ncbi:hypothetical protein RN001_011534 [Aquatica leii]|uniref:Uncharacterized protein n=1 Tax=Aquatica leii TaxID=1421715 RepID=A0AAN7P2H5_9COLE|nr:hypothetical protein RN001_011534 [Aquatica leii]
MPKFLIRITFISGAIMGFLLGLLLLPSHKKTGKIHLTPESKPVVKPYEPWFTGQNLQRHVIPIDTLRYSGLDYYTESMYLYNKIRILCVVLVHKIKYAKASLMTWTKQCNHIELVHLKPSKIGVKRKKEDAAWPLLCKTLVNTSKSFHWVFVVNDNTFALVENIRYLVAPLNHSSQYYLGHAIKFWGVKYNVGSAGYLISNATLAALKLNQRNSCITDSVIWNLEDYYLGKTLSQLNITVYDTRDELGFGTFHGFNLQKLFFPGSTTMSNYYKYSVYPTPCCSPKSVTFQVSNSNSMYTYEYLLKQLQVFTSGTLGNRAPATQINKDEVWKSILKQHGYTNTNVSAEEYYEFWVNLVSDPTSFAQKIKTRN